MKSVPNWDKLTWQERREERFRRWLSPKKVKFVNPEAERLYKNVAILSEKIVGLLNEAENQAGTAHHH